MEDTYL